MITVLINAYTCCPGMGSEQGMGWNWITSLAQTGDVELFVVSEGEYKEKCEDASKGLPIRWYWNPVPQSTRDKCWNQGNWSFYPLYEKWQKKTAEIAREICSHEKIDILHQLNMIGFREPGYLWQVSKEKGIPFVWGPIGGLKQFPVAYTDGGGLKMKAFALLKNAINIWQIKYDRRVNAALIQSSLLVSSIPDSFNALKKHKDLESVIIPETGCFINSHHDIVNTHSDNKKTFNLLWVGKFDFRKRLDIALHAVAQLKDKDIILKVYGTGNDVQKVEAQSLVKTLGIENKVMFMGSLPNEEVKKAMLKADIFFFTSVNEDTSTVVLEAVSNSLPVVCFDCCGMAAVIDDRVGRKIPLSNPKQSVKDFAREISRLYDNRELLSAMSANCFERAKELSWENKANKMVDLYRNVLAK